MSEQKNKSKLQNTAFLLVVFNLNNFLQADMRRKAKKTSKHFLVQFEFFQVRKSELKY